MIDVVYNDEIFGYLNFYINYQFFYVNYDSAFIMIQFPSDVYYDEEFIYRLKLLRKKYNKNLHYFIHTWKYLDGMKQYDILKEYCDSVTILANTFRENFIYQKCDYRSIYCNHNCWINENIFKPILDKEKKYDIVINVNKPFYKNYKFIEKTIKEYKSLFVEYDVCDYNFDKMVPYKINKNFKDLSQLNPKDTTINFDFIYMCKNLNSCKMALNIFDDHNINYAMSEYLLCGLPLVKINNKKNKIIWCNDYNSIDATYNETNLNKSIQCLLERYSNIDRLKLHNEHVAIQKKFRLFFIEYVKKIFNSCELTDSVEENFIKNYTNRMLKCSTSINFG
jgi:hypothetical protein